MQRHSRPRNALTALGAIAVAIVVAGAPAGQAAAGGWAVTSLDAVPVPRPGEVVTVTFTILQHGQRPVEVDDVAIEVVSPAGDSTLFAAEPGDRPGRYTADVVFDGAGDWTWSVHQGWFGEQPLGTLSVTAAGPGGGGYDAPAAVRVGLPVLAVALAAAAALDALTTARRGRRPVAA